MSRGIDNRNPGNIRRSRVSYRGEVHPSRDPDFKQFSSMAWGYRAMFVLLHTYSLRHGCRTLRSIISRYAPPEENNTEAYLRRVADATHLLPDEPLSTTDGAVMTAVVAAMSEVENGVQPSMQEIWGGWQLFVADFPPK